MEFSFSQKFESLIVSFDDSFRSCLLESYIVILTFRKYWIPSHFFVLHPFISKVVNFAQWFLRKKIMEPALLGVFGCPPTWSCPQLFKSGLGMRLYEGLAFDTELFSCRIFKISKLFLKQKSFWHRFKADSFWRNSSDSYGEVFRSDENFLFWFLVKNMKWHLVGHKRLKFQFEG
jgi:hypothetical protein